MKQRKIIWQIFPANILILVLTVGSVAWFGKTSLESFFLKEEEKGLTARAYLVKPLVIDYLKAGDVESLREYCKLSGRESQTRITVILSDGKVVADSNENPESMELHHKRLEVAEALKGDVGVSVRFSKTLSQKMLYVAIPLFEKVHVDTTFPVVPEIGSVLRMSVPIDTIEGTLADIFIRMFFGLIAFAILAVFASLLVSRNISKPLEELKHAAERFSTGNFADRMASCNSSSASLEVATLAVAMDKMANEISHRIETIKSQRNELETVFSSMIESVIAVDREERIINLNNAAAKLLEIDREKAKGKIIQEVLRNFNLQQQITHVLATGESMEDEIIHLDSDGEKFLQTNLVSLNDQKQNVLGVLVVMNDVTKLRRLENVRRDFVANVSHELRTPITSIRGYVETLLDGALDNRDDALKFLDTVLRQAERLNEIIEDLLALSRIEQEADHGLISLERAELCPVLDVAVETCELKAREADVSIHLDCSSGLQVSMNGTLVEQAIVNLLVNAIRYSKRGGVIHVTASSEVEEGRNVVKISVKDNGIGIAESHLPRLFERFYRSDKARSRKQGGTGLGLAIVKHIVLAHNGRVDVVSEVDVGSTFTITLPGD